VPILDRDGVRIRYDVHGEGPAVLFTHGYGASRRMWAPQAGVLGRAHRLITWDMRGHGDSDYPDDPSLYSQDATVGDMAALLDACGAERAVIGGLSLGGYMSLAFHIAHPERVRALVLLDTGPGFRSDAAREAWNQYAERYAANFEEKGLAALNDSPEVAASAHRSAEGLALAARGMLVQRDSRAIDSLPGIEVPTLILVGERDKPFLDAAGYMAAKIPGAVHRVIAGAGHAVNLDQPEAVNAALLDFLDGLDRG
jgi:pimeloyl-ACP methyl ester carboxylesterase